jgi:hypothetical protein
LLLLVLLVLSLLLLLLHVWLQGWRPLQRQHIMAAEVTAAATAVGVGWREVDCCALCCCVVHFVTRGDAAWCTF